MAMPLVRENDSDSDTLRERVGAALSRYNDGDATAMTDLVRGVTPWLFHVCRGYRLSTPTAEDVVQTPWLLLVPAPGVGDNPERAMASARRH